MRTQSNAAQDCASEVVPPVTPRTRWRVAHVEAMEGFRLRLRFVDGLEGEVDMSGLVHNANAGVFAALADPAAFAAAHIEHGAVVWPGELDLAPDAMYRAIAATGRWIL